MEEDKGVATASLQERVVPQTDPPQSSTGRWWKARGKGLVRAHGGKSRFGSDNNNNNTPQLTNEGSSSQKHGNKQNQPGHKFGKSAFRNFSSPAAASASTSSSSSKGDDDDNNNEEDASLSSEICGIRRPTTPDLLASSPVLSRQGSMAASAVGETAPSGVQPAPLMQEIRLQYSIQTLEDDLEGTGGQAKGKHNRQRKGPFRRRRIFFPRTLPGQEDEEGDPCSNTASKKKKASIWRKMSFPRAKTKNSKNKTEQELTKEEDEDEDDHHHLEEEQEEDEVKRATSLGEENGDVEMEKEEHDDNNGRPPREWVSSPANSLDSLIKIYEMDIDCENKEQGRITPSWIKKQQKLGLLSLSPPPPLPPPPPPPPVPVSKNKKEGELVPSRVAPNWIARQRKPGGLLSLSSSPPPVLFATKGENEEDDFSFTKRNVVFDEGNEGIEVLMSTMEEDVWAANEGKTTVAAMALRPTDDEDSLHAKPKSTFRGQPGLNRYETESFKNLVAEIRNRVRLDVNSLHDQPKATFNQPGTNRISNKSLMAETSNPTCLDEIAWVKNPDLGKKMNLRQNPERSVFEKVPVLEKDESYLGSEHDPSEASLPRTYQVCVAIDPLPRSATSKEEKKDDSNVSPSAFQDDQAVPEETEIDSPVVFVKITPTDRPSHANSSALVPFGVGACGPTSWPCFDEGIMKEDSDNLLLPSCETEQRDRENCSIKASDECSTEAVSSVSGSVPGISSKETEELSSGSRTTVRKLARDWEKKYAQTEESGRLVVQDAFRERVLANKQPQSEDSSSDKTDQTPVSDAQKKTSETSGPGLSMGLSRTKNSPSKPSFREGGLANKQPQSKISNRDKTDQTLMSDAKKEVPEKVGTDMSAGVSSAKSSPSNSGFGEPVWANKQTRSIKSSREKSDQAPLSVLDAEKKASEMVGTDLSMEVSHTKVLPSKSSYVVVASSAKKQGPGSVQTSNTSIASTEINEPMVTPLESIAFQTTPSQAPLDVHKAFQQLGGAAGNGPQLASNSPSTADIANALKVALGMMQEDGSPEVSFTVRQETTFTVSRRPTGVSQGSIAPQVTTVATYTPPRNYSSPNITPL